MRLIDADVLMDHVGRDRLDSRELIMKMIENAPTVDPSKECQACGQKTCNVIVSLQEEIKRLREQRWIPVTESLPKSMANKVLVFLDHDDFIGYIGFGHYEKYHGTEIWYDLEHNQPFSDRGYTVTHWMPLPDEPEFPDERGSETK